MELKIPGVGEPETPATQPAAEKGNAGPASLPAARTESTPAGKPAARFLAVAAFCIGLAAVVWAFALQKELADLHRQLASAQSTADAAFRIAKMVPAPRDFASDIARLEATMTTRLKAVNQLQSLPEELKRIPVLEAHVASDLKAITNTIAGMAATVQSTQDALNAAEKRIADIAAVLKNQDKVLRRLAANDKTPAAP